MSSSIGWLWPPGFKGESWNPVTGCEKISPGCAHCYAELFARRFKNSAGYSPNYLPGTARIVSHEDRLSLPMQWKRPRFVFVNSQSDLFHPKVSNQFIGSVFATMWLAQQHTYLILTKRPDRMFEWFYNGWLDVNAALWRSAIEVIPGGTNGPNWPLPNVWLGVSTENQRFADARIPLLLSTPAAVRFISYEPALKPIDFSQWFDPFRSVDGMTKNSIDKGMFNPDQVDSMRQRTPDWLIIGGESGSKKEARMCVGGIEEAMRSTLTQCQDGGVAYFGKQMGSPWAKANGDKGKGENMNLWPEDLRVREWPQAAKVLA